MTDDAFTLKDLNSQKIFAIEEGDTTIGRGSKSTICLPDSVLSREHAVIRRAGNQLWVKDLDSTNGTRLNKSSVGKEVLLQHGDVLKLGEHALQVLFPGGGEVAPPDEEGHEEESYVAVNSLGARTTLKQAFSLPPGWSHADKGSFGKKTETPAVTPSQQNNE